MVENLMSMPQVDGILLNKNNITITKSENADWIIIKPQILSIIMEYALNYDINVTDGLYARFRPFRKTRCRFNY